MGLLLLAAVFSIAVATQQATVNFASLKPLRTQLGLQVVVNPVLEPATCAKKSAAAFELLRELCDAGADLIRYVPWFPFPKLGVAALQPPNSTATSYDFTLVAPQLLAFLNATRGRRTIINFSTQPQWMYAGKVSYPADPLAVDWSYSSNLKPTANTTQLLAAYYANLVSWIAHGSFKDERGRIVGGGPAIGTRLSTWELYNEIESDCHELTPSSYAEQFDVVTAAMQKAAGHKVEFVGLALASRDVKWVEEFLKTPNRDAFSFHYYSGPRTSRSDPAGFELMIADVDTHLLGPAQVIVDTRNAMSPSTKIYVDEVGTILPRDNDVGVMQPGVLYYQASGAMFAYTFVQLARIEVEAVMMSQLVGSAAINTADCRVPDPQYPSVSMFDPETEKGNARAEVLKVLLADFRIGATQLAKTTNEAGPVFVQGLVSRGAKKALLVNRSANATVAIAVNGAVFELGPFEVRIVPLAR